MDRNNTNFPLQLLEHFRAARFDSEFSFLKYYQNFVREYIGIMPARGLLINHEMGLGKSVLAVTIAMELLPTRRVIFLLTKSLRSNMEQAIHKYVRLRAAVDPRYDLARLTDAQLDAWINRNFSFVSMNASNMLEQMSRATSLELELDVVMSAYLEQKFKEVTSLDGACLIVDESQNFTRAITNGSKNAIGLYNKIMESDCLLFFLTGTPITNDPFELVPCFNMLAGRILLPESYSEFRRLYVDEATDLIKNKAKFQNRIFGLVSSVKRVSTPGAAFGVVEPIRSNFPAQETQVIRVHMDPEQYTMYQLARDKEREETKAWDSGAPIPRLTRPRSAVGSSYRVRSRQLSNYCPPQKYKGRPLDEIPDAEVDSPKFRAIYDVLQRPGDGLSLVYSQFIGVGGLGAFIKFMRAKGWKEFVPAASTGIAGGFRARPRPHVMTIGQIMGELGRILRHRQFAVSGAADPPAAGRQFAADLPADDVGAEVIADLASLVMRHADGRTFAVISGEVDTEQRQALQDVWNRPENAHGELISLFMLSSTGAEGLDLKRVRNIFIMEPHFTHLRILQVSARGVRNESHADLPEDERRVKIYIMLAIPPKFECKLVAEDIAGAADGDDEPPPDSGVPPGPTPTERLYDSAKMLVCPPTTDTELYDTAVRNYRGIMSFLDAISEVSIEALANNAPGARVCAPTGKKLFTDDPRHDVATPDPCHEMVEKRVVAQELIHNGVSYRYKKNDDTVFGWDIYAHDKKVNVWKRLPESDPQFMDIIDALEKRAA